MKRQIEFGAQALALEYGIKITARCPGPPVSILTPGTVLTCVVSGSPKVRTMKVTVGRNGLLFFSRPLGIQTQPWYQLTLSEAVRQHKSGARTTISGSFLERYIQDYLKGQQPAYQGDAQAFGNVTCPSSIELTGSNRGECTVLIAGQLAHYSIWIDHFDSFQVQRIDALIDLSSAQQVATSTLNQALEEHGYSERVNVQCGSGLLVARVPSHFYCKMLVGLEPAKLVGTVEDSRGFVNYHVIMLGSSPPPELRR